MAAQAFMSLHDSQQHLWFGVITIESLLVLSTVPCALGFVEDDGVI